MQRALSVYLMSKARGKLVYAMKEHESADNAAQADRHLWCSLQDMIATIASFSNLNFDLVAVAEQAGSVCYKSQRVFDITLSLFKKLISFSGCSCHLYFYYAWYFEQLRKSKDSLKMFIH